MTVNRQLILAKRPVGLPDKDTWRMEESSVPGIGDQEMLVKNIYVSLDPAMRGWMNDAKSYLPPVQLEAVMRALTIGKVVESSLADFQAGDFVQGTGGVQDFVVTDGKGWYKIDPALAPVEKYMSLLGMTGYTAYFGLLRIGEPKEGETILVSGAAGAVGSVVGQVGKLLGCRVVGTAGGLGKCSYVTKELGFDACIDYKQGNIYSDIKKQCPDGIDVYFDNVGGEILNMALALINRNARIVLCGAISHYNATERPAGPSNYMNMIAQRGKMQGFIVFDYAKEYSSAAKQMAGWIREGKLRSKEQVDEGMENFHSSFLKLFSGDKEGKLILKIN